MIKSDILETFSVGEHVVYPQQGVGKIEKIEDKVVQGKKVKYYIIYIEVSEMTIMLPCHTAVNLGLRHIASKSQAVDIINNLSDIKVPTPADWKARYQMNMDFLKDGSLESVAKVVKTLYSRSKVKELPVQERKLYDNALRLLVDEICLSTGEEGNKIEEKIFIKLEGK